ncbi:MAG: hypothetical protein ACLQAR_02335 [Steroidobacteraceae bacterium]
MERPTSSASNSTPKTSTTPGRECKSQCIRHPFAFIVDCHAQHIIATRANDIPEGESYGVTWFQHPLLGSSDRRASGKEENTVSTAELLAAFNIPSEFLAKLATVVEPGTTLVITQPAASASTRTTLTNSVVAISADRLTRN